MHGVTPVTRESGASKLRFDKYNFNYTAQVSLQSAPACRNCQVSVSIRGFNSETGHDAADLSALLESYIPLLVFDADNWNITQEIELTRSADSIAGKTWFLEAWVFSADERSGYARKRSVRVEVQFDQLAGYEKSAQLIDKFVSNVLRRLLGMSFVRVSE